MNNDSTFRQIQNWMHRNARNMELCLWKYFFEEGSKEDVVKALLDYQNEDGGFGNALEVDSWNPNSTPITTNFALNILREIEYFDMTHPIYQGIWKYLNSKKGMLPYGWSFTIPTNDNYPHAPWWNYSEEENQKEYYGVTAKLSAFILEYGNSNMEIYQDAVLFTESLLAIIKADDTYYGDMGLKGFVTLIETLDRIHYTDCKYDELFQLLSKKITAAIEHDTEKWSFYGVRPSDFIDGPNNRFYLENEEIVKKELEYLLKTKPVNDVWGITWTWFGNMEHYEKYFCISENWWKGFKAIEHVRMLRNFDYI